MNDSTSIPDGLLPCRDCGGDASLSYSSGIARTGYEVECAKSMEYGCDCFVTGLCSTEAEAIIAWITCISTQAPNDAVGELRTALRRLMNAAEADMNSDNPEGIDGSEIDAANKAILDSYPAVFDAEQVAKITAWQECGHVHPLTCPNQPHGFHDEDGTPLPDDLFAHQNGLFCPHCDYRQDWVPDVCFEALPAALAKFEPVA